MSAHWPNQLLLVAARVVIIAVALCITTQRSSAETNQLSQSQREMILAEAQQAYDKGVSLRRNDAGAAEKAFHEAAARFEQLTRDGVVNGALQYDLGNAQLQAGELGNAILHYRAAESILRGDPALKHNLDYARSLRMNQIEPSGGAALWQALFGWHINTSTLLRSVIFIISWLALWASLLMLLLRSTSLWRWTSAAGCAIALATGISIAWDIFISDPGSVGVVLVNEVIVRKGNGEGYEPQFREPLSEGVEFELLEQRPGNPGWWRVELPDGNAGWIRADQAGLVRDALSGMVQ